MQVLKNGLENAFSIIFPRVCIACDIKLKQNEAYFCEKCYNELIFSKIHISDEWEIPVKYFSKAYSEFKYSDIVKQLVHSLKYENYTKIAKYMAYLTFDIAGLKIKTKYDYLVPVPLHKVRQRERGYNQALLIAKAIGKRLDLPVSSKIIYRTRYTSTQTQKNHEERLSNVSNAFKLYKKANVKGKKILLIDDVVTTGSTLNTIAHVLKENHAKQVDIFVFAWANEKAHSTHSNL